jgi:hypothetical protein
VGKQVPQPDSIRAAEHASGPDPFPVDRDEMPARLKSVYSPPDAVRVVRAREIKQAATVDAGRALHSRNRPRPLNRQQQQILVQPGRPSGTGTGRRPCRELCPFPI